MLTLANLANAFFSLLVVICLILISAYLLRAWQNYRMRLAEQGGDKKPGFLQQFAPAGAARLEILETRALDFRRKLVLIRRDNVQHLLLCGDGRDIVIETGIPDDSDRTRPEAPEPNVE